MGYTACWFTKSTSVSVMYLSSLFSTALAVISLAGSTVSAAALSTRDKSGTISFVQYKPELIFEYSTPTPDAQNWIGIYYASYGGPEKEQYVNDAVDWQWAEKSKGKVYMATDKLQPGEYTAYFMAKNGYNGWRNLSTLLSPATARSSSSFPSLPLTTAVSVTTFRR